MNFLDRVTATAGDVIGWLGGLPWWTLAAGVAAVMLALFRRRLWSKRQAILGAMKRGANRAGAILRPVFGLLTDAFNSILEILRVHWFSGYFVFALLVFFAIVFVLVADVWTIVSTRLDAKTGETVTAANDMFFVKLAEASDKLRGLWFILIGLAGALAIPLVLKRAMVLERQTRVQEKGHVTDRIIRATELLGVTRDVVRDGETRTVPAIEVRLGAIYTLERVAQESVEGGRNGAEHWPIMETMLAYIRQRRAEEEGRTEPADVMADFRARYEAEHVARADAANQDSRQAAFDAAKLAWIKSGGLRDAIQALPKPTEDVSAAIAVLRRRTERQLTFELGSRRDGRPHLAFELDETPLHHADLRRIHWTQQWLGHARLQGANLSEARLEGADLTSAKMSMANLNRAQLRETEFMLTELEGAVLDEALLVGARLFQAQLEGASLNGARLDGAYLVEAQLEGAYLLDTWFVGANLKNARLGGANLLGARLDGASLIGVSLTSGDSAQTTTRSLSQRQIRTAFGDGKTRAEVQKLGLTPPTDWETETLYGPKADQKWRAWRKWRGFE